RPPIHTGYHANQDCRGDTDESPMDQRPRPAGAFLIFNMPLDGPPGLLLQRFHLSRRTRRRRYPCIPFLNKLPLLWRATPLTVPFQQIPELFLCVHPHYMTDVDAVYPKPASRKSCLVSVGGSDVDFR